MKFFHQYVPYQYDMYIIFYGDFSIFTNIQQARTGIHPHFMEFLLALGWPINIHNTWKRGSKTGKDGSGKHRMEFSSQQPENHGGSLYNGEKCILYWADVTSEIAFVVPTEKSIHETSSVWGTSATSMSPLQNYHLLASVIGTWNLVTLTKVFIGELLYPVIYVVFKQAKMTCTKRWKTMILQTEAKRHKGENLVIPRYLLSGWKASKIPSTSRLVCL